MDRSINFFLIVESGSQDSLGQWVYTTQQREVYGRMRSVTQNEYFNAGQNGHYPEFSIVMNRYDYQNERNAEVLGEVYTIYRTYWKTNDEVELYFERRAGDSNEEHEPGLGG